MEFKLGLVYTKKFTLSLKDPILGPFMLFNIIFNWKFFLVLVSSEKVSGKIDLATSNWSWLNFLFASFFTIAYVFFWPKVLKKIDQYLVRLKITRQNAIQREETKSELISLANAQSELFYRICRKTKRPDDLFSSDMDWKEYLDNLKLDQFRIFNLLATLNGKDIHYRDEYGSSPYDSNFLIFMATKEGE